MPRRKSKFRTICGLKWSGPLKEHPACIPLSKPKRGCKAEGVRFEHLVKRAIQKCEGLKPIHGQWWQFEDLNGKGLCQTDMLFQYGKSVFIVECKLSDSEGGQKQLERLYLPVLRMALPTFTVCGIVCVKNLREGVKVSTVCQDLSVAIQRAERGTVPILQYLGRGPI